MTTDQSLVFIVGMILVVIASLEYWRPWFKGVV